MTKQLTKQSIGVGVAGTGFIGPAHIEGLRRNGITVLGLAEETPELAQQKAAILASRAATARWLKCWPTRISMLSIWPRPTICIIRMPKLPCWPVSMWSVKSPLAMNSEQSGELVKLAAEKKLGQCHQFQHSHVSDGAAGAQYGSER